MSKIPRGFPNSTDLALLKAASGVLTAATASKSIPLPDAVSEFLSEGEPTVTPKAPRNSLPGVICALGLATGACVLLFLIWNDPLPGPIRPAPALVSAASVAPAFTVLKTCSEQITEEIRNPDGTVQSTKTTRSEKVCQPAPAPISESPGLPIAGFAAKVLLHVLF